MNDDFPAWLPEDMRKLYGMLSPVERERLLAASEGLAPADALSAFYAAAGGRFADDLVPLLEGVRRKLFEAVAQEEVSRAMTELWRLPLLIETRLHDVIAGLPTVPNAEKAPRPLESE